MIIISFNDKNSEIKYLNLSLIVYIERDIPFEDECPGWRLYYGPDESITVTNEEFICEVVPVLRKYMFLEPERPTR